MSDKNKKRIALLYGGSSSEREISLKTGLMIKKNLTPKKFRVKLIDTGKNNWQKYLVSNKNKFDLAFVALHGKGGEDGVIQGFLESIGLPYTGSEVMSSAVGMDKILSLTIFKSQQIIIPPHLITNRKKFLKNKATVINKINQSLGLPCIIKPNNGGSSVGVFLVKKKGEIEKIINQVSDFDNVILVEKYLKGIELTAGVLGNWDNPDSLIALPIIEIIPNSKHELFDYVAKYTKGVSEEIVPARISRQLTKKIQKLTLKAYKAFNCRGFARFDIILVGNIPYFLEVNTIPGMTETSLLPKAAKAYGLSFPQMLEMIINLAVR